MVIQDGGAPDIAVVEIADKFVNKIDILAHEGDRLPPPSRTDSASVRESYWRINWRIPDD